MDVALLDINGHAGQTLLNGSRMPKLKILVIVQVAMKLSQGEWSTVL